MLKLGIRRALFILALSAALVIAGVAVIFWPLALILAGVLLGGGALWLVDIPMSEDDQ